MEKKYVIGSGIIAVFLIAMIYLFTQTKIEYENDFKKVMTSERSVKATGSWIKEKGYEINEKERTFAFYMTDVNGVELKVVYKGAMPNNFESATSVVVTGKYQNGIFNAKDVLTKCPSKYESRMKTQNSAIQ